MFVFYIIYLKKVGRFMKKKILSLVLAVLTALSAVTIFTSVASAADVTPGDLCSMDFETDPATAGWTSVDNDGDGYNWILASGGYNGSICIGSKSYINEGYIKLDTDNWLFSPPISIPSCGAVISWYDYSFDEDYPDAYTVYVGETATASVYDKDSNPTGMKVLHEERFASTSLDWENVTAELSAAEYGGKTVYIAFRHKQFDGLAMGIDHFTATSKEASSYYHFNFDSDPTTKGWINMDVDGDGNIWNWLPDQNRMQSVSWSEATKTLDPDNWLLSPKITIPAGGAEISWDVVSGSGSYSDHYGVFISSTTDPKDAVQIYDGTAPLKGSADTQRSVIVPKDWNGKDCYIVFRHFQSRDKWSFSIGDFKVSKPSFPITNDRPQNNSQSNNGYLVIDNLSAAEGETVTVTVVPNNNCKLEDNSLKVTFNDGVSDQTIYPTASQTEGKYTFTMPPYAVTVTAVFKPLHTHNLVKVNGQTATESTAGHKDYYECKDIDDACHKYFEDATGLVPIEDLATWKTQSGKGYIPSGNEITAAKTAAKAALDAENAKDPLIDDSVLVNGKSAIDRANTIEEIDEQRFYALMLIGMQQSMELSTAKQQAEQALDNEEALEPLESKSSVLEGKSNIGNASTKAEVASAKNDAINKIQSEQPSRLAAAKTAAKAALDAEYAKNPIKDEAALNNAKAEIDNATNLEAIENAKTKGVESIVSAKCPKCGNVHEDNLLGKVKCVAVRTVQVIVKAVKTVVNAIKKLFK